MVTGISSREIGFYSDASALAKLGFGVLIKTKWSRGDWNPDFIRNCKPSIEFLELYALTVGILLWEDEPEMNNGRIILHCDNTAVVQMVNNLTSSCKNCMTLI